MKDFGVNYVHQESKTIPDVNYTFETAMMPVHLPRHEAPPTHKDVLLKTWAQDTEAMAKDIARVIMCNRCPAEKGCEGKCREKLVAYLNSAAEVGK